MLVNIVIPVFSMNLAENFTSNDVTRLLESAVDAFRPDLETVTANKRIDPSFVLMKQESEKILGALCS